MNAINLSGNWDFIRVSLIFLIGLVSFNSTPISVRFFAYMWNYIKIGWGNLMVFFLRRVSCDKEGGRLEGTLRQKEFQ